MLQAFLGLVNGNTACATCGRKELGPRRIVLTASGKSEKRNLPRERARRGLSLSSHCCESTPGSAEVLQQSGEPGVQRLCSFEDKMEVVVEAAPRDREQWTGMDHQQLVQTCEKLHEIGLQQKDEAMAQSCSRPKLSLDSLGVPQETPSTDDASHLPEDDKFVLRKQASTLMFEEGQSLRTENSNSFKKLVDLIEVETTSRDLKQGRQTLPASLKKRIRDEQYATFAKESTCKGVQEYHMALRENFRKLGVQNAQQESFAERECVTSAVKEGVKRFHAHSLKTQTFYGERGSSTEHVGALSKEQKEELEHYTRILERNGEMFPPAMIGTA